MAAQKITLTFAKERETKGTVVYQEVVEGDARGHQFYLLKDAASSIDTPERISMVITAA